MPLSSYFDRDVACVRQMFKRKFGYESHDFPTFESLTRDDDLDIEVSCSGYGLTKEMEEDMLQEYGITDGLSDIDSSDDGDDETNTAAPLEQVDESTDYTVDELSSLRQQVDAEVQLTTVKASVVPLATKSATKFDSIASYIQSVTSELGDVQFSDPPPNDHLDTYVHSTDGTTNALDHTNTVTVTQLQSPIISQADDADDDRHSISGGSISSTDLQEAQDDVGEMDPNSREYRMRMVKQILSDARSQRSYSTTASTIAPTVIKGRIKKTIELKEQREVRKRCLAKGEANATTRGRKENKDTVKEYAGWDF